MTEVPEGGGSSRRLGTQDLHVHTSMSDGDLTLEELVGVASELGVTIGVADHVSGRNSEMFVSDRTRLEDYLAALESAPVLRSAELCWCDPFGLEIAEILRQRCHYLIGSNHGFALPDGTFGSPWWQRLPAAWVDRPDELMEIMVRNLCDMVTSMPIEIAAHPTFMPAALLTIEDDVEAWWTPDREDRLIEAAVASGVALEISNRYRLPHDRFLRKAREAGATFSLGSDGHHLDQVARLGWAVKAAGRAGITDRQLFYVET
jgi:histidinol phosphatase-like PHP family hydrolase